MAADSATGARGAAGDTDGTPGSKNAGAPHADGCDDHRPPVSPLAAFRRSHRAGERQSTVTRTIRGPTETQLHLSVAEFLDWALLPPAFYTTFPAGWGVLSPSMAQRLKKSGLKAGMPDIMVFFGGGCIGIELKTNSNRLSPAQEETFDKLIDAGVYMHVCRSIDDVINVLCTKVPLRKMTGPRSWQQSTNDGHLGATSEKRAVTADVGGANG
jgi:hypothetical protein